MLSFRPKGEICIISIIRGRHESAPEGAKRLTAGDEPREFTFLFIEKILKIDRTAALGSCRLFDRCGCPNRSAHIKPGYLGCLVRCARRDPANAFPVGGVTFEACLKLLKTRTVFECLRHFGPLHCAKTTTLVSISESISVDNPVN